VYFKQTTFSTFLGYFNFLSAEYFFTGMM